MRKATVLAIFSVSNTALAHTGHGVRIPLHHGELASVAALAVLALLMLALRAPSGRR